VRHHHEYVEASSEGNGLATKYTHIARVLVVDDDPALCVLCQDTLQHAGFVVLSAQSDEYVLDMVERHLFDVVVIGVSSVGRGGLPLLERMRQQALDVPVVAVPHGFSDEPAAVFESVEAAVQLGVEGVLFPPVDAERLHDTLRAVLVRHQQERRQRWAMVQHMVQSEKLSALGRLVTSIAHEMNNPLQALHSSLTLMSKNGRSFNNKKRQQYLGLAQGEVENLITIVRRMLEFYRPSMDGMRPLNVNMMLDSVLQLVDGELDKQDIRVQRDWCPKLPDVFAIGSRLKQVCHQLISNAIEAMPNGGSLTVRTYTLDGSEYQFNAGFQFGPTNGRVGHMLKGPSVVVEISDTGPGIAADDMPKIFEPFYSTRFEAKGLGLAISYSIIEQHRGELSVSSNEGEGTTVRVRLPVAG
jgi:signal transduction histidine kinase